MSAIIGALRAELSASIASFQEDLGKAAKSVSGFVKSCNTSAASLERVGSRMSLAITAPLLLIGKASLRQATEVRQAMAQVEAALESTGGVSGKTAAGLNKAADALENISTFDKSDILKNVTAQLLRFGNIAGDNFDKAQLAAVNLSARLGIDLPAAAAVVGKALNQPVTGLQALRRLGITFTADQQKQIRQLVATGHAYEAQAEILDTLAKKFGGAALAQRNASPDAALMQSWRNLEETLGNVLIPLLTPLVKYLDGLVKQFQALSPAVQESIIKWAALAAAIGPALVVIASVIRAFALLAPAVVFLTTTMAGWIIIAVALAAALIYLVASSDKLTDATDRQRDAHEELKKALDAAKASGTQLEESDRKLIEGKLKLAQATLKAAEAQAIQDLATKKAAQDARAAAGGLTSMGQVLGAELADNAGGDPAERLVRVRKLLEQNATDLKELQQQSGVSHIIPKSHGVGAGEFNLGPVDHEAEHLQKTLDNLGRAAAHDALDVRRFASGGLDPLGKALEDVDTRYLALRDTIKGHEDELKKAGLGTAQARSTYAELERALAALELAHKRASEAAREQYKAETALADLKAQAEAAQTTTAIRDLMVASGRTDGPLSTASQNLQRLGDQLATSQSDAAIKLKELENQRAEAAAANDEDSIKRLDLLIGVQRQYYELVSHTTAEQLQAAQTVAEAWTQFADDLSSSLADMIVNFKFDVASIGSLLRRLVADLLKPATDTASSFITAGLKSLFSGFHAEGGMIPTGQWGVVGEEGPELAFGGRKGKTIVPMLPGSSDKGDIYIDARGADDAAVTRLAGVVANLQRREKGRVLSYAADAGRRTRRGV